MRPVADQTHLSPRSVFRMSIKSGFKLLAIVSIVAFIPVALYVRVNSKNASAANTAASAAAKPLAVMEPKKQVSVQASGRGNPFLNLKDGRQMALAFRGNSEATLALQSGAASSRTGAAADLDGDGAPDLVVGYANGGTGVVTVQRGNPEGFAP